MAYIIVPFICCVICDGACILRGLRLDACYSIVVAWSPGQTHRISFVSFCFLESKRKALRLRVSCISSNYDPLDRYLIVISTLTVMLLMT